MEKYMRNNLLSDGELLSSDGNLNEAGYAFSLIKKYNKENIKVSKLKIKEWDYYYIGDKEYGIALTIDDNGYTIRFTTYRNSSPLPLK